MVVRLGAIPRALKRAAHLALLCLLVLLVAASSPASAQTSVQPPSGGGGQHDGTHRSSDWSRTGGMSLNSPESNQSGSSMQTGYDGTVEPPGWLFDDPESADDPWHFLPMTRSGRINDFFSTGEGGIASPFSGGLNAIYSSLIAVAFTIASFTWVVTSWLVRLMVGAPTLASEFMSQISSQFDRYAVAVIGTGWVWLLLVIAILVASWRVLRGATGKEGLHSILGAAIPLSLILALAAFQTTITDVNGQIHVVRGPEWLFTTSLRLSGLVSEPVQALTDVFVFDDSHAPDQLVTCDAYGAVLEANFIRAWNAGEREHLDSAKFHKRTGQSSRAFRSAPAAAVYDWAQGNDDLRMRLALTTSRIWERAYLVGYGNAQFGDTITAERASCLIADWRNRKVSPLEQLAIWRETCFLQAFQRNGQTGSLALGSNMALTGCSLMPQIAAPELRSTTKSGSQDEVAHVTEHLQFVGIPLAYSGACAGSSWLHPTTGIYQTGTQDDCIDQHIQHIQTLEPHLWTAIVDAVGTNSPTNFIRANQAENLRAEVYAAALFNPSNHYIDGNRFALRTLHGTFAACEFTDWLSTEYISDGPAIDAANDNKMPLYPTHAAQMNVVGGATLGSQSASVDVPAQARIDGIGGGSSVRVDARMWGLGFDGFGEGGHGQPEEIVTPNACLAYIFGAGLNDLPGAGEEDDETPNIDGSGTSVWTASMLGIHDDTIESYKDEGAFRWSSGRYPPPAAWLDATGNGSQREFPGANNFYTLNRLGRTPEEYQNSASLWPLAASVQGAQPGDVVFDPSLSQSLAGADVFQAIHGRDRGELALMAIIAVIVGFAYMFALSGLALGSALSIVVLALLIMTLPITLLFAAAPFERAKELPKKLLKMGIGAAVSYALFLFVISFVLLITDLILGVAAAVEVHSDEFWYTLLLGLAPFIALVAGNFVGKQFGVNVSSFKGAMKLTSGMAFGELGDGGGQSKAKRYARMGMRGIAYGPMMRGMTGGGSAAGAAMRTTPGLARTAAAAGMGATMGATAIAAAQGGFGDGGDIGGAGFSAGTPIGPGPAGGVGGAARAAKGFGGGQGGGMRGRLGRMLAPKTDRAPGRIRRGLSFARSHPAMMSAALLFPFGGFGGAAALYGASKVAKMTGIGFMARGMIGMPMRGVGGGRGSQTTDMQWLGGHVRHQRQRMSERLTPDAPAPVDPGHPQPHPPGPGRSAAAVGGAAGAAHAAEQAASRVSQQSMERMVRVGPNKQLPASVVAQAHAEGPPCGGQTRTTGAPCRLPASVCEFGHDRSHQGGGQARPAAPQAPVQQHPGQTSRAQQANPDVSVCGAPLMTGGRCQNPPGDCPNHRRRGAIDPNKRL